MSHEGSARAYSSTLLEWLRPVHAGVDSEVSVASVPTLSDIQRATPLIVGSMYGLTDDIVDCLTSPFVDPHEMLASEARLAGWAIAAPEWTWTWASGLLTSVAESLSDRDPWRQLSARVRAPYVELTPNGCARGVDYAFQHGDAPLPLNTGATYDGSPFGSIETGTAADFHVTDANLGTPSAAVLRRPLPALSAALIGLSGHMSALELADALDTCASTLDALRPLDSDQPLGAEIFVYAWCRAMRWVAWRRHQYDPVIDELLLCSTEWAAYAADLIDPEVELARIPIGDIPRRMTGDYDVDVRWRSA